MLRIDLLRHLPAPEKASSLKPGKAPKASKAHRAPRAGAKPSRSRAGRTALGLLLAAALIAGGLWITRHPEWRPDLPAIPAFARSSEAPANAALDSARRVLEARAASDIAGSRRSAARLSSALEAFLPLDTSTSPVSRAVFTPPDAFLLRGESVSSAAFARLRDSLQRAEGIGLQRADARPNPARAGRLEFILSGTIAPDTLSSGSEVSGGSPILGVAALDRAWAGFLESASAAGVDFAVLPAGAPTSAGSLQAHPYRIIARCDPRVLHDFLASAEGLASPFGIRRITWESSPEGRTVSLDIMAFSRR